MYFVDGLKVNILFGNDVITPEDIMIDLANSTMLITRCNVRLAITARQRGQLLRKMLMADITIFLPLNSESLVPVTHDTLPGDCDFFF